MWTAHWKNFFHQVPVGEHTHPWFTVKAEGGPTYQFKVLPQGWSWSPCIATAISYGIALGEWPSDLKYMVDWEALEGDTSPAFVPLRDKDGNEIGLLTFYIDNLFVILNDKDIMNRVREHVIRRAAHCQCAFKLKDTFPVDPITGLHLPEDYNSVMVFLLGMRIMYKEGRIFWNHANPEYISLEVPLSGDLVVKPCKGGRLAAWKKRRVRG